MGTSEIATSNIGVSSSGRSTVLGGSTDTSTDTSTDASTDASTSVSSLTSVVSAPTAASRGVSTLIDSLPQPKDVAAARATTTNGRGRWPALDIVVEFTGSETQG
ncbi:MAG TPA: hypothetical protein VK540_30840 [Polyangiaceae bacterium]|nr:hypothetical protein [Polyangiaceae bacterium]